jgi:hypothetical protein
MMKHILLGLLLLSALSITVHAEGENAAEATATEANFEEGQIDPEAENNYSVDWEDEEYVDDGEWDAPQDYDDTEGFENEEWDDQDDSEYEQPWGFDDEDDEGELDWDDEEFDDHAWRLLMLVSGTLRERLPILSNMNLIVSYRSLRFQNVHHADHPLDHNDDDYNDYDEDEFNMEEWDQNDDGILDDDFHKVK